MTAVQSTPTVSAPVQVPAGRLVTLAVGLLAVVSGLAPAAAYLLLAM